VLNREASIATKLSTVVNLPLQPPTLNQRKPYEIGIRQAQPLSNEQWRISLKPDPSSFCTQRANEITRNERGSSPDNIAAEHHSTAWYLGEIHPVLVQQGIHNCN
jgi:hypothetical protein